MLVAVSFLLSTHFTLAFAKIHDLNHYQLQANCLQHWKIGLCDENGVEIPPLSVTDSSNYKGKSQAYWGPLPTLLPLVLNNILHQDVSEQGQMFIMTNATLYMFFILLTLTLNALFPETPQDVRFRYSLFGVILVGLSSFYLHVASFSYSWFISIAGAQFFVIAHWILIIIYLFYRKSDTVLILTGVTAGFGLLSKQAFLPSFTLSILLVMLYAWPGKSLHQRAVSYVSLLAPYVACVGLLLLLNYARFDDPFESGLLYQNAIPQQPIQYALPPTPRRWGCNFYNFALTPFKLTANLSFIEYQANTLDDCLITTSPMPPIYIGDPIFLSLLLAPFLFGVDIGRNKRLKASNMLILQILLFLLPITLVNLGGIWPAMRFVYDIGWLLTLAAVLIILGTSRLIDDAVVDSRARNLLKSALLSYLLLSLVLQSLVAVDYVLGDTIGQGFMYSNLLARGTDAEYVEKVNSLINPLIKYAPFFTSTELKTNP